MDQRNHSVSVEAHPLVRHREAFAAAWRDAVHEVSASFRDIGQARLRDRIEEGTDALICGAEDENHPALRQFLSNLEAAVDQGRFTVEEVIAGLLAAFDALDRAVPEGERYALPMVRTERALRSLIARFSDSAVRLVTEKLQIEAEAQRESRARLMALQRVGAAVTSSLDLESALETIVHEAAELMNGATARLRLADEEGQNLELIASAGDGSSDLPGVAVPVETTLAGLCYRSGRPVISNDVASDPRANPSLRDTYHTRSLLCVPLMSRGAAIGVLSITNISSRPFEDADAEMLSLFADHAAVAIENGRLFQQAQSQITEMEIINRVSAMVSASLDLTAVFRSIHREIARIMVADAFLIMLRNDNGGYDLSYIIDLGREFAPRHDIAIPGAYLESMDERRPQIIEATTYPEFVNWERYGDMSRRVQSLLVAPLTRGGEPIGIISAQSYAPSSYRQRDADLLTTVANVAAIAIENARLYEQAHRLAVADERNRLAREIHDTIAQGLVGIVLQLEAVSAMIEPDSKLARRINRAIDLARVNLDEARRSVRDLRAAPLEHMSLAEALQQLAEQHQDECGGEIRLLLPDAMPRLETNTETAVFRFVQEALTNCRKHAPGTDVTIEVRTGSQITISVADNGPGFDVAGWAGQAQTHHFGLQGMRERAERLGGALQIDSVIGSGTTLVLRFPIDPTA